MLIAASGLRAEEKAKDETQPVTPVKVTVVFNEYAGEKKVSSLPYIIPVNAASAYLPGFDHRTSLRMGLRVPYLTAAGKDAQVQYQDVGTDIDCYVRPREDGRFLVNLTAARNSVYSSGQGNRPVEWHPGDQPLADRPIFSGIRANQELLLRDGQTVQAMTATDPVSGRVIKIDVTLNVVK